MRKNLLLFTIILSLMLKFSTIKSQTAGTLTAVFTPTTPTSATFYQVPRNVLAVWIENSIGTFIKTNIRNVGSVTSDHLQGWAAKCGCASVANALGSACNIVGATTGATRSSFASAVTFTWNGTDVSGTVVPDGAYNIKIESTWNHATPSQYSSNSNMNYTTTIAFTKGTTAATITPTTTNWIKSATFIWQPVVTTNISSLNSENFNSNIYPNPTEGIFNVYFSKATTIKVFNTLGICIYSENISELNESSKSIDLSNFPNGIYVITVFNGNNVSNHKIILNK